MDSRIFGLRRDHDRAIERVQQCRAALARFDAAGARPGDVMLDAARDRLANDLRKAETDAAWTAIALADVTSPMEVPEQQETDLCQQAG